MKKEATFDVLRDILNQITDSEPDGAAFLEADRGREKVYSQGSVQRWLEVIQILEKNVGGGQPTSASTLAHRL